ncbi:MAG: response regulator [Candidatus Omnitrophica bacterium]|nr:response regulator [Candidatus Omnitrophota bacterium]
MGERKKKILFIEDEPDQVKMISLRLEKNGYEVIAFLDGEEGVQMAVTEKPDLVLVDVLMPGIDVFEVCRRLRKDPATKHIPIISTTAAGMDDVERQCIIAGADDCVRKPYDSADLLRKIRRLLEK